MPKATSTTVGINGYALRTIRKLMNLTPQALADSIGKDRTYVVKIETGAVTRVSTGVFDALVSSLHLEDRRALSVAPHAAEGEVAA